MKRMPSQLHVRICNSQSKSCRRNRRRKKVPDSDRQPLPLITICCRTPAQGSIQANENYQREICFARAPRQLVSSNFMIIRILLQNACRPSGPIAYVDSHIPFTNPENPDRNRSCDRCDDPAEVECQKCHCSPLVWRCLKCFQYHASKDAKIRRLANRMANAPEGDGYESDSSE